MPKPHQEWNEVASLPGRRVTRQRSGIFIISFYDESGTVLGEARRYSRWRVLTEMTIERGHFRTVERGSLFKRYFALEQTPLGLGMAGPTLAVKPLVAVLRHNTREAETGRAGAAPPQRVSPLDP